MLKELSNLRKYYAVDGQIWAFRGKKSKKEMLTKWLMKNALQTGSLQCGQAIAEITAGNMGVALAKECRKIGSKLYLIPIGKFEESIIKKLSSFSNVEVIEVEEINSRKVLHLFEKLESVIAEKDAFCFRQFSNTAHLDFYRSILRPAIGDLSVDCVIDKAGTGATLRVLEEIFSKENRKPLKLCATTYSRPIDMTVFKFFDEMPIQVAPKDKKEYFSNFERILAATENLANLSYAKLSLYCAIEWLRGNPGKKVFVYIGD